jgi:hypothetical protein
MSTQTRCVVLVHGCSSRCPAPHSWHGLHTNVFSLPSHDPVRYAPAPHAPPLHGAHVLSVKPVHGATS